MTTDSIGYGGGLWEISERINYRQMISVGILVGALAYVLIVYPLAYYGQFVAADAQGAPIGQEQQSSLLNRVFFPVAAGLSVLMYLLERGRSARINLAVAVPFFLFWALLGLSSTWSLSPSTSVNKLLVFTLMLMAVVPSVAVVDSAERYLKPMFWVAAAALVINLAFIFLTPASPIGHTGIYSHKNSLGGATAFCFMFVIFGITQPQRLYRIVGFLLVPIALYALYRSQAKTALGFAFIAPAIAGIAVFARYYFRLSFPLLLALAAPVVLFALFGGAFDLSISDISMLITGDPTFTGRTELWQFAMEHIAQNPLLGYGFQSFWQVGDLSPAWEGVRGFLQRTPHAHQGYLDILLQVGAVGLALFGLLLLITLGWISRKTDESPRIGLLMGSIVAMSMLVNLLETNWLSTLDPGSVMFVIFLAGAMLHQPARPPALIVREAGVP